MEKDGSTDDSNFSNTLGNRLFLYNSLHALLLFTRYGIMKQTDYSISACFTDSNRFTAFSSPRSRFFF